MPSTERSLTMWLEMLKPANKQKRESKYQPIREIYKQLNMEGIGILREKQISAQ